MPIVAVFGFPNEDIAKYHKVFEVGGKAITVQPKRLSHVCFQTDGGFTVVDVWEDEASFAAFGEVIGPATTRPASTPGLRCTHWGRPSPRTASGRRTDEAEA